MIQRSLALAAVGAVGLVVSLLAPAERLAELAVREAAAVQLFELGRLVGVREPDGSLSDVPPRRVHVAQEGGPLWLAPATAQAVEADAGFELTEQTPGTREAAGLLRVEMVGALDAFALRAQLWQRGSGLAPPDPTRRRVSPWALVVALAMGALALRFFRRLFVGVVIAAAVAQGLNLLLPWPENLPALDPVMTVRTGPLATWAVRAASGLGDLGASLAAGVAAAALVLAVFDHLRSRRAGRAMGRRALGATVTGVVAGLVATEAVLALGMGPWLRSGYGVAGALGAACLWAWAWREGRSHRA